MMHCGIRFNTLESVLKCLHTVTDETICEMLTSCRWTLAYMGCIYMMILYALRINMGIAIVCMVKPTNETINLDANVSQTAVDECPGLEVSNNASSGKTPVSPIGPMKFLYTPPTTMPTNTVGWLRLVATLINWVISPHWNATKLGKKSNNNITGNMAQLCVLYSWSRIVVWIVYIEVELRIFVYHSSHFQNTYNE